MFLKLCKYELKSISRILLSIYLAVIVLSVVNGISASINGWASRHTDGFSRFIQIYHSSPLFHNSFAQILQNSAWIAYFVLIFALFIVTLILVVQRFYHGLLCREGYMMFSLPVPVWQLIASKAVVGLIMALISSITVFASIFILMMSADPMEFVRALLHVPFGDLILSLNAHVPLWPLLMLEAIALMISATLLALFHIYAALALGHLFKKHRLLMAFAAYIVLSIVTSIIQGAFVNALPSLSMMPTAVTMFITLLGSLAEIAVLFVITERVLSKRLNLE